MVMMMVYLQAKGSENNVQFMENSKIYTVYACYCCFGEFFCFVLFGVFFLPYREGDVCQVTIDPTLSDKKKKQNLLLMSVKHECCHCHIILPKCFMVRLFSF